MKGFFRWLGLLFSKLPGIASTVAEKIQEISAAALPVVKLIAEFTPTRTDDEILRLFEHFLLGGARHYLALPVSERGPALLKVATALLARQFPGVPIVQIQAAIQLALVQHRA